MAATLLTLIPNTKGHSAHAVGPILQPTDVTSTLLETTRRTRRLLINQSGLSERYTSEVSDFTDITSRVTHDNFFMTIGPIRPGIGQPRPRDNTLWANSYRNLPVILTFDLGDSYTIQGFALWNDSGEGAINNFELFADNNNDFDDDGIKTSLLRSSANLVTNNSLAQVFTFTPTETQFVHLRINSNHGRDGFVAAGEVAFAEIPFEFGPIPGIIGIVAVGGLNYFRNKKRGN